MFWWILFGAGLAVALIAYLIARRIDLMAIVDLLWTAGVGLGVLAYFLVEQCFGLRAWLILLIVSLWSSRLSFHILSDRVIPGQEDRRYANLAEHWGEHAKRNFLAVFLIQVPFVMIFLVPISIALRNTGALQWTDFLAIGIAICALVGEAVADRQLAAFRKKPENKGGVCKSGLWRYSRHPNYFFEWLHWWAYVAFAWSGSLFWLTLIGPVSMYLFLRFITGVPHAERSSLKSRGEAYRDYQSTTNAFFPWPPRLNRS